MNVIRNIFHDALICKNVMSNYLNGTHRVFSRDSTKFEENVKLSRNTHKVDKWERMFLIWTNKRYKTPADVPDYISQAAMERARSKMRIRIVNLMMLFTAVGAFVMSVVGKRAHDRGESLQRQNLNWHQQIKKEAMKVDKTNIK